MTQRSRSDFVFKELFHST